MNPIIRKLLIALFALALAGLLGFGIRAAAQPEPQYLHGQVEMGERRIASKVPGRVDTLHVRTGDRVAQGDTLFTLDSPEILARLEQAQGARDAASSMERKADTGARAEEIEMARRDWQRAQAQADLMATTYQRMATLHDEGLLATQDYEETRARWQAADNQAEAARAQYDMAQAGTREEDRAASAAQVRQAEGSIAEVQAALDDTLIRAPMAGEIADLVISQGELAPAGFPVITLIDPTDVWVVLTVREDHLPGLSPGQRIDGYVPGIDRSVTFEVTRTLALPDFATWRQVGEDGLNMRTFQVEARPVELPEGLRPGMSVRVSLDNQGL